MPGEQELSNKYKIVATVKQVVLATAGYGDTERVIGVKIEGSYVFEVNGEVEETTIGFVLPHAYRRYVAPGDKVTLTVSDPREQ